jgi:hypothetical protein
VRFLLALFVSVSVAVTAGAARADDYATVALPAADDVSLSFLCDWGYNWDERCYRDRLDRLELGGDPGAAATGGGVRGVAGYEGVSKRARRARRTMP